MNKRILFIDGIGDYSVIQKINRFRFSDYHILIFAKVFRDLDYNINILDARVEKFCKEYLYNKIDTFQPDYLIIRVTQDNFKHIERLKLESKLEKSQVILLTKNLGDGIIHFSGSHQIIDINERIPYQQMLKENVYRFLNIFNHYNKNFDSTYFQNVTPSWDLVSTITNNTPAIYIGSGCDRSCSFCAIADSKVELRPVESVINEIKYLLDKNIQYFHIADHNFISNLNYVIELCERIIHNFKDRKFVWSCFIIPEFLLKDMEIVNLLIDSKLVRFELGIESGSNDILKKFCINPYNDSLMEIIRKAYDKNITSILANFIIGGPNENKTTIEETKTLIEQLIELAPGTIEFNLSYFYPEYGSRIFIDNCNYDYISNPYVLQGSIKTTCLFENSFLSREEIIEAKNQLVSHSIQLMKNSISKTNIKKRLAHIELSNRGLTTQYFFHFFHKNSTFERYNLFKGHFNKFSWEIENEIDDYAPYFLSLVTNYNEKNIISIDRLLQNKNDDAIGIKLNFGEYTLINLADGRKTISEIVNFCLMNDDLNNFSRDHILNLYKKIESYDLLIFTKLLR